MVRLKHRYLLLEILYPHSASAGAKSEPTRVNDFIEFHSPSPSRFDERTLARLIRDNVSDLFGDYGVGKVAGSLKGMSRSATVLRERRCSD
jgi:ribonuclease P/MRP protein subunit POP5